MTFFRLDGTAAEPAQAAPRPATVLPPASARPASTPASRPAPSRRAVAASAGAWTEF
jgi:hypothetical protein